MEDWKVALISSTLLAVLPLFLLRAFLITPYPDGPDMGIYNGFLLLMVIYFIPLTIALLITVLFFKKKMIGSLLSLVFGFLNSIFTIMFIMFLLSSRINSSIAVIIIITFELISSILLILTGFRSYRKLKINNEKITI